MSDDGLFAVVGHNAWVSYIDLTAATIIKTWPTSAPAGDVVLGDPMVVGGRATRFAYVFPSSDQWVAIHNLDLGNGREVLTGGLIYAGMTGALEPGTLHLFGMQGGLSPAQLYRFDIDADAGTAGGGNAGSPYWGSYAMGNRIWISSDDQQILTNAGTRFRAADMTYAGTVTAQANPNSVLAWADWSSTLGAWAVQPGTSYYTQPGQTGPGDTAFYQIDAQYLANPAQYALPPFVLGTQSHAVHGKFIFFDSSGQHFIAVAQVDSTASLLNNYLLFYY